MRRGIVALGAALAAFAVLAIAGGGGSARANGVPQLVKLTYLAGVSNYGPTDAEGVLEFSFAEAYARVDVKNLKPIDGYSFEGWLTGGSGAPILVGTIDVDAAGLGTLDTKLAGLSNYDYNLFVVAARKAGDSATTRPAETSIAGRFTVIGDDASSQANGDVRPSTLPDTGEDPGMSFRERVGRTITIMAASAGLMFFFLRFLHRRRVTDDQGSL
jgi:hypothetical protein